jgi:nitroreductase
MDDALRLLRSLRATRQFRPAAIPDRVLAEIIDVARWTGSARNRQPWRLALVHAPEERATLSRLGAYAMVLEQAPVVVLLALDRDLGGTDAEFDGGRFAQTLMLAAHSQGIGSCPVTFFPVGNAHTATTLAGFTKPWFVRTAIALGYPATTDSTVHRRSAVPVGRLSVAQLVVRGLADSTRSTATGPP